MLKQVLLVLVLFTVLGGAFPWSFPSWGRYGGVGFNPVYRGITTRQMYGGYYNMYNPWQYGYYGYGGYPMYDDDYSDNFDYDYDYDYDHDDD